MGKESNAILWINKPSRDNLAILEQLSVLMREFNNAAPPIVLIMNGCEAHDFKCPKPPKKGKDKEKYQTQLDEYEEKLEAYEKEVADWKQLHRNAHFKMGQDLADAADVKIMNIMAGADRADLREYIKPKLARFLIDNTEAQTSTMRD